MNKYVLYALLEPDSLAHLKSLIQQSPISMLDIPALYIGYSVMPLKVDEHAKYSAMPTTFSLQKNPVTGNTSLVLGLTLTDDTLEDRFMALDSPEVGEPLDPCIIMSDMVHAIPRNYRAYLNSIEETFAREQFEYEFHAEFVVEQ